MNMYISRTVQLKGRSIGNYVYGMETAFGASFWNPQDKESTTRR